MNTKFSLMLKSIRTSQGYKQFQFAKILGCEPSYLSALERAKKDPPKQDKLEQMIKRMGISEEQAQELRNAAEYRIKYIKIPQEINEMVREMCVHLNKKLPNITTGQAKLINQVLGAELEEFRM